MSRRQTDPFWIERIRESAEDAPRAGTRVIRNRLEAIARDAGRKDWPSERTIGRVLEMHRLSPEAERQQFRTFRWPQSMLRGELTWEESAAALELAAYLWRKNRTRALLPVAKWFSRITQAAGDAPIEERFSTARRLATWEMLGLLDEEAGQIEAWLRFAPWRGRQDADAYRAAIDDPAQKVKDFRSDMVIGIDGNLERIRKALELLSGSLP